jgi:protein-L-isoaspartate(D-aspartate) O-methyltransferase
MLIICIFFPGGAYGEKVNYAKLRRQMAQEQIMRRGITDRRILNAFLKVKRHLFVKPELRKKAYGDYFLDIGEGQSVSQPYIVAIMTYVVSPDYNKKVLEVGTGSGYSAAILAELVKHVYTIEYIAKLGVQARKRLDGMGYKNIKFKIGDGYEGWERYAPYDGIIVTCSEDHIPPALIKQLAIGGRMIIPVSYSNEVQELVLIEKLDDGTLKKTNLIPVQFVPLIRGSNKK